MRILWLFAIPGRHFCLIGKALVSRKVTEKLKLTRLKPTTLRRSPWFLDSQVSSIMAAPSLSFSVRSRSISRGSCHAILQLRSRLSLLQTGRLHSSTSAVLILRPDPLRQSDWSMFMPTELIVSASCDLLPRWRAAGGASLWLRNMNIYGPNKYPTWYKYGPPSNKFLHYATTISSTTPLFSLSSSSSCNSSSPPSLFSPLLPLPPPLRSSATLS